MKLSGWLGSFGLYVVLPALTGAVSGFIGTHLLFSLVKALEKWRGKRVATALTGLVFGLLGFATVFFLFALEFGIALVAGFAGAVIGLVFGSAKSFRIAAILISILIGFLFGFGTNIFASFYLLRHDPTAEISVLVFNLVFALVGGILGAVGGAIRSAAGSNNPAMVA